MLNDGATLTPVIVNGWQQGWVLPEPAARAPVHTRSIVCRSFRRDDGLFDIDARFVDTRPFDYDSEFRGHCPAGAALHHMQLRVTFDRVRTIVALQAAMPGNFLVQGRVHRGD